MSTPSSCKGCSADVHVTQEQIENMVRKLARFPDACVTDDVYENRLSACSACPSLQYGTTCAHCGCVVQVRAKFLDRTCPAPGGSRWAG
ncbi:DUF6171 domain-containing protein [Cohnella lubricantis]|uniref:Uncharacterized protein n=1 Tax=Cohnella lubricantis TaxID=2163172 RepID=A0A841TDB5_9BACL|nr:DUF6171 family protein [Cohnella lubricantis]MBB6679443.1 hypothetical protein [Cohnella lubricantis]MBP2118180.1 Fe-S cluster biogenesis protein NfuA [Cohnella lubricantis]